MKILQILILILGLSIFANAQKAILRGTIYNEVGAVIVNAKIVAITEQGKRFETVTNEEGIYQLNLPYTVNTLRKSKIAKFNILVDVEDQGFEKFYLKDFNFVSVLPTKEMSLDVALNGKDPEPCGYSGGDCLTSKRVIKKLQQN